MLVAPVLHAQQRAGSGLRDRPHACRWYEIERPGDLGQIGATDNVLHGRERANRECDGAGALSRSSAAAQPITDDSQRGTATRRATHRLAQICFRVGGDGAAVEHRGVRLVHRRDHGVTAVLEHRANGFGVVVIGATPEGAQIHLHAGTAPLAVTRTSRCAGFIGSEK